MNADNVPAFLPDQIAADMALPATVTDKPAKPRIWTVFATWFAAAIAGEIVRAAAIVFVGATIGIVLGSQGVDAPTITARVQEFVQRPLPALVLTLVPFQFGMLAVVFFAARRSPTPFKQRLGLVSPERGDFTGLRLASLGAFTVSAALATVIVVSALLSAPPAPTSVSTVVSGGSWWTLTFGSLLVMLAPAIVEEVVFRGYIQRRLLQRWSPAVAIGVSTLLFAVLHSDSLQHILAVVPLGLVTGLLAHRTNSIQPGMIVHGIHNTAAVAVGAIGTALTPSLGDEGVGMLFLATIAVLGLLGLPAVISLVRNKQAPVREPLAYQESALPQLLTDSSLARHAM